MPMLPNKSVRVRLSMAEYSHCLLYNTWYERMPEKGKAKRDLKTLPSEALLSILLLICLPNVFILECTTGNHKSPPVQVNWQVRTNKMQIKNVLFWF